MSLLLRRLLASLGILLFLTSSLSAQDNPPIFPLRDIRPGMKGVGRTIFQGADIEEFQVVILGVLKNAVAPQRDMILARLSGGPLATTGVISGMSGSPVYIDGKLVGAVSRSFPLSKEPIAGITPIEEMMTVVPSAPAAASPATAQAQEQENYRIATTAGGSLETGRVIAQGDAATALPAASAEPTANPFSNLLLPLRFAGISSTAVDQFRPQFERLGLEPMAGGMMAGGGESLPPSPNDLQPGSMISLMLLRGDMDMNIDCTVTMRRGDELYACGHQVLAEGPAQFPFAPAHVIVVVPLLSNSFKLDEPGTVVGTIQQDRFDAIYGRVGDKLPPMIPVHLHLDSSVNRKVDYNFEMIREPFLSPLLLNMAVTSALGVSERTIGASTLNVKVKYTLTDGRAVELEDVLSGELGTSSSVGGVTAAPLALMMGSGFPDLKVQDVDLNVVALNEKRTATIEQVWSTKSEVKPGDRLEVTALLRLPTGETMTEKIPVEIPGSVTEKMLSLVVGGGATINALELRFSAVAGNARDSEQLVRALNRMRRNNRVYALLMSPQRSFVMQGDEYPSPPPSMLQTFMADAVAASNGIFSGTSVVGDFETTSTPYVINGQKTLILKVAGSGM
jgi:hypothetical protein